MASQRCRPERVLMSYTLDPALLRDLTEAKAALTRHGIVIIRAVESELEPAIMAEVRDSLQASPRKLAQLKEFELDVFVEKLREAAAGSAEELKLLYTRLLAKLGTENVVEVVNELEGIGQLFKWERIAKAQAQVNALLEAKGFKPVALAGPEDVSDGFKLELEDRWDSAFSRFKTLAERAAEDISRQEAEESSRPVRTRTPKKKR